MRQGSRRGRHVVASESAEAKEHDGMVPRPPHLDRFEFVVQYKCASDPGPKKACPYCGGKVVKWHVSSWNRRESHARKRFLYHVLCGAVLRARRCVMARSK